MLLPELRDDPNAPFEQDEKCGNAREGRTETVFEACAIQTPVVVFSLGTIVLSR